MKLTVASHTHGNNLKVIEFLARHLNIPKSLVTPVQQTIKTK